MDKYCEYSSRYLRRINNYKKYIYNFQPGKIRETKIIKKYICTLCVLYNKLKFIHNVSRLIIWKI